MKLPATTSRIGCLMSSQRMNASVIANERAKWRSKSTLTRKLIVTALALAYAPLVFAAPTDGNVSAGSGTITQVGTATTINQQSQNLAIDWNSFSIGANESVTFRQPDASSVALNRILGQDPSQIFGSLNANGQVFILNPNGVLFGRGSQVNVGGLVASSLNLSNADLMAGNYSFSNDGSSGAVVNKGKLTAANGGYIALLAPEVRNQGLISATLGTALLAAGDKVTLNINDGSLLGYSVDEGSIKALAENRHLIRADGGQVIMTAEAADALSTAVVNNTGIIEARTLRNVNGVIMLMGDMDVGQVNVGGTLNASAPRGGDGGFIETSAAHVSVSDGARITTAAPRGQSGTWLIDPVDFTIAASGGDISGATLSTNLGSGNVTIFSTSGSSGVNGDVNVNDAVSWSANTLTLNAYRNINLNANLSASATGKLALEYGQGAVASGNTGDYIFAPGIQVNLPAGTTNFTTKLGSDGIVKNYTVITSLGAAGSMTATDLQGMNGNLAANYVLGANINAAATSTWNAGAGFAPVGNSSTGTPASQYTGTFNGLGHTVSNLVVNRPTADYVGLFGYTTTGSIVRNIGMVDGSMTGRNAVGGLIGHSNSIVSYAYARNNITGTGSTLGGLLGYSGEAVTNSYATGDVEGVSHMGGLVGISYGSIDKSYATGSVDGSSDTIGGLVGNALNVINNSYATGNVSGHTYVGGLVGYINGSGSDDGSINTSYSSGNVTGSFYTGGLVGINYNTISNSYWDTQTSGTLTGVGYGSSIGATGLTTAEMMTMSSFAGWNIANTSGAGAMWRIFEGNGAPILTSYLKPVLTVTANNDTQTYDAAAYAGGNGLSYSDATGAATTGGAILYGGNSQGAINAGGYVITASGLYSLQQGFDAINYVNGTLTINPAVLSVTANADSKGYNGLAYSGGNGVVVSGFQGSDPDSIVSGTPTYSGSSQGAINAGGYLITPSGMTSSSANYTLAYVNGALTVDPAPLLITAGSLSKTYGQSLSFAGTEFTNSGLQNGETLGSVTLNSAGVSPTASVVGSPYAITASAVSGGTFNPANYDITYADGALTVNPAALTITANNNGKVFNDVEPDLYTTGVSYAGLVNGESAAVLGGALVLARDGVGVSPPAQADPDGSYAITASGLSSSNYAITYAPGTFQISPIGELLIVMSNGALMYGADPASMLFAPVYAKYNNGSNIYNLLPGSFSGNDWTLNDGVGGGATFTANTSYVLGGNIGNYSISTGTVTQIGSNFSTIASVDGNLTVTPAALTVTADNDTKEYNGIPYSGGNGVSYSGFVSGDTAAVLGGGLIYGGTSQGATNVGASYTISPSGLVATNYILSYVNGVLSITPRPVVLAAAAPSKSYDGTNALTITGSTVSISNKVLGDDVNIAGSGSSYNSVNAGTGLGYTLNGLSLSGTAAGNYSLGTTTFIGSDGVITPAALTITANNATKVYGQTRTFVGTEFINSVLQNGETLGSVTLTSAGSINTAGVTGSPYAIIASAATGGSFNPANYNINYVNGLLSVNPAALTVTANGASKVYDGTPYSGGNGVSYSGFVNGETSAVVGGTLTYGGSSQGAIDIGSYQINPTGLTASNYTFSYINGLLEINSSSAVAAALGGDKLVLAYNSAQNGINHLNAVGPNDQAGFDGKLLAVVNCGVQMPSDSPSNLCK